MQSLVCLISLSVQLCSQAVYPSSVGTAPWKLNLIPETTVIVCIKQGLG